MDPRSKYLKAVMWQLATGPSTGAQGTFPSDIKSSTDTDNEISILTSEIPHAIYVHYNDE